MFRVSQEEVMLPFWITMDSSIMISLCTTSQWLADLNEFLSDSWEFDFSLWCPRHHEVDVRWHVDMCFSWPGWPLIDQLQWAPLLAQSNSISLGVIYRHQVQCRERGSGPVGHQAEGVATDRGSQESWGWETWVPPHLILTPAQTSLTLEFCLHRQTVWPQSWQLCWEVGHQRDQEPSDPH